MNYPSLLVVVFIQEFLFLTGVAITNSQRTNARQSTAKMSPTVTIPNQGTLMGREILLARPQKVTAYLGIPYAQPPVRFTPPVTDPPVEWEGVRNATQFEPSCLQDRNSIAFHEKLFYGLLPKDLDDPGMDEKCLFLNIFVPDEQPPDGGWPVMVWFHGGDFNTGTPAIWDPTIFVNKEKILIVTVAYRLNIFGFFTSADSTAPGNYGLLDQLAALEWIQRNIKLFSGSPENVVIAGHNAGAISVGLHIVSPRSKGKFSKAIVMSGDPIETVKLPESAMLVVKELHMMYNFCNTKVSSEFVSCLRGIPAINLLNDTAHMDTWGPIVDGMISNVTDPFLPKPPIDLLEENNFNGVPLITGYTSNEQSLAYLDMSSDPKEKVTREWFESQISQDMYDTIDVPVDNSSNCEHKYNMVSDAVLFFYRPYSSAGDQGMYRDKYLSLLTDKNYASKMIYLASRVSRQSTALVYRFDYRPRTAFVVKDIPDWAGVPHMFELPFVWGLPYMFRSNIPWSTSDKNLSEAIMRMFGLFIREGNASLPNIRWDPFTEKEPGVLVISTSINRSEVDAIDHRMIAFWNDYIPRLIAESINICCNSTSAGVTNYFDDKWDLCITSNVIVLAIIPLFYA